MYGVAILDRDVSLWPNDSVFDLLVAFKEHHGVYPACPPIPTLTNQSLYSYEKYHYHFRAFWFDLVRRWEYNP